ncbi:hypothetical protein C475_21152 [Halosimplex carlsbadense 2-9-1]|uniref:Uncharacterized protein n=1 Tax=Halosimplex carlsbadense 2-9-1 TaxID=797114 RepID=M0CD83_9EURY|nr:hypothetical protein [Halosimplex carlsbadense]ELZ20322.1 hypothetical protein C475_21152 [Halosimplex carlsbadense 2-9-1]
MALREYTDDEYERLQRSERELTGNRERAEITDVAVVDDTARLTFGFEWTPEPDSVSYDLDDARDVMELKSVAGAAGYEYDQLPYLEGETIPVVYLDDGWVPAAALPGGGPETAGERGRQGPSLVDSAYRRLADRLDDITARSVVLGVIVVKKLLIASALVYLLVA